MTGTLVGVTNACINWGFPAACSSSTAVQDSVSGQDTAVFTIGSTASDTIKDLPAGIVPPALVDFMTVQSPLAGGVVHFDLTSIVVPALPAGNNCTVFALSAICNPGGGSPFLLTQQTSNEVGIQFSTVEEAYTGTSGTGYNAATVYDSIFTTQLSGCLVALVNGLCPSPSDVPTIPNVLAFIAGGGTVTATWSATQTPVPTSTTPEPMSFLLLGSGLMGISWLGRRYRRS